MLAEIRHTEGQIFTHFYLKWIKGTARPAIRFLSVLQGGA